MITIPTLSQLYDDILSDLEIEFSITIPIFGKVFLRALAAVQAAKLKIYYLAIGKLQKNIFVDTADRESSGGTLERFGRIKLGRNPFAATAGKYTVTVTGTIGALIEASTTFKSDDDSVNPGKLFILDNDYTLIATSDSITLRALEAGIESKLDVNDTLTATIPIANVDKSAVVTSENVIPLDEEDIEAYRTVTLQAYQIEAQGGSPPDYRLWAADAQGVLRVYPYAKNGASNEGNLFIEATIADSIDGMGTPSAQLLLDVEAVVEFDPDTTNPLNERGRRPMTVFEIHYIPVTIKQIDIDITSFVNLTAANEILIFNAIKASIDSIRPFVPAIDIIQNNILNTNSIIKTILVAVPGSIFGSVDLMVDSSSVSTVTFSDGDIPYLNIVSYYG